MMALTWRSVTQLMLWGLSFSVLLFTSQQTYTNKYILTSQVLQKNNEKTGSIITSPVNDGNVVRIKPGELPGYTGWARLPHTMAPHFVISNLDDITSSQPTVGQNLTLVIQCNRQSSEYKQCKQSNSIFYVRAYGKSLQPGLVKSTGDKNTHNVIVALHDAGIMTIEVVLAFSNVPSINDAPSQDEPGYEGFLLPQFPIIVNVNKRQSTSPTKKSDKAVCAHDQLVESSSTSALATGRWIVADRVASRTNYTSLVRANNELGIRRSHYESGEQSLGIIMDYEYNACNLISEAALTTRDAIFDALRNTNIPQKPIHVLMIGDSNMRIQANYFEQHQFFGGGIKVTHLATNGGVAMRFDYLKNRIERLQNSNSEDENFFIMFNSGLHSIFELCDYGRGERRATYLNSTEFSQYIKNDDYNDFSCTELYRDYIGKLTELVYNFPAVLKVWQTSFAAWPKYGVYGTAWPQKLQTFPLDPSTCQVFNEIAWDVVQAYNKKEKTVSSRDKIGVMDSYWLSYARPDHRQVDEKNSLTGRLMHTGPEVYSVLMRKWSMLMLEAIRSYEAAGDDGDTR